ncbi:folate-binding protein [Auraticoccus sp. F435]|uniref:Folate-binding protein n=1 Tax=Auraticoccus cholistanensis TaxID=2656650 RepID=A0A6A9V2D9_9ACTN|nr:folate-binding protein [Auraticoccus cholistanensis]MVA77729.1 folate-binding protein [Auraticoccus cholistanensis]
MSWSDTAVLAEGGPDAGVAWHHGDPMREQRAMDTTALVDLSSRGVISVTGPDRLSWLHSLTTQHLEQLAPGVGTTGLVLSPQGHVEHAFYGVDDGETFWAHTEPGAAPALVEFLDRMRFMLRVEVADRTEQLAVVWQAGPSPEGPRITRSGADSLGGHESFVPRDHLDHFLAGQLEAGATPAGTWAYEARRIAAGVPRVGIDTDHRTIPNEIGVLGVAVHLDKGCYRGQETVARVHNLGRPPRRLVLLHLDGSVDTLPERGSELVLDPRAGGAAEGKVVGFVGSSARHHELGPIALGLVKRSVDVGAPLLAGGVAAAQEVLVDPEVGLHVRARL